MTDTTHWPFGPDGSPAEAQQLERERERERKREQARAADAALRQQTRNNRLLVGGRAHVKKPGLS